MNRHARPLFVLAIMGGFLLLIVVTCGPLASGRGRPTELLPAADAPPASAPAFTIDPQIDSACPNTILVAEDAGPDRPAAAEELAPLDLSGLTPARLRQLDGQRLRLRVITDSGGWRVGDRDVFEALMKDGGGDLATVWMYQNPDVEDGMTVEGRLCVVHHRTIAAGPTTVKAFTEYRLGDAIRR